MLSAIISGSALQKGGLPVASSYKTIPRDHQSDCVSWPYYAITSGDMYYGVPQIDIALISDL